jgi:hypothetical protein
MRLHGWCERCRRVKLVYASGHALATARARDGLIVGVCAQCEEDARKKAARS